MIVEPTGEGETAQQLAEDPNDGAQKFYKMIGDVDKPLYVGCTKFSIFSAIVVPFQLKTLCGWTNKSFTMLLQVLMDMLPSNAKLPKDHYEAKKIYLGLDYEKIHACPNNYDRVMRYPADLDAWKMFDNKHLQFSSEPRNVRLGLAADKFNPFGIMSTTHSTWLVMLVPYNLPFRLCMKRSSLILSLLISSPTSSRIVIDVYLCVKLEYEGRWLDSDHEFRDEDTLFDGSTDIRVAPVAPVASDILVDTESLIRRCLGKKCQLLYTKERKDHKLRHNLDVMHIEKNVMGNILGTVLNLKDWTKDNYKARLDLADMGIRSELHQRRKGDDKYTIPPACFHMTPSEKDGFLQVLRDVRVPDGYASNISRRVNLKECKENLFQNPSILEIENDEAEIAVTLCELEKIFPPSFFTMMVHLVIHLATEAKIGGLVQYRWMYSIERAALEGSIVERYIVEECLKFCSQYMEGVETIFNQPTRVMEDLTGAVSSMTLDNREFTQAHRYVLFNSENIYQFHEMHKSVVEDELQRDHRRISPAIIHKHHMEKSCGWFRSHVMSMIDADRERIALTDTYIIELNYSSNIRHVLFKYTWVDDQNRRGYKTDEFGFPMMNFMHSIHGGEEIEDESYVSASQAIQVFYVEDKMHKDWYVVVKTKVRDVFDASIGPHCAEDDTYGFYENILYSVTSNDAGRENLHWGRNDVEGMTINASITGERDLHEMDN
nr:uncharacterized protein LOC111982961 [Quercus suber]